ncbi:MAG: helix-turn-helix domain-containing protein [Acidobacteriota bacterium]
MWKLKDYVEQTHKLKTAGQLQVFIEDKVGVKVTVQTIRALLRGPAAPRREMVQLLCDALNCHSDAFYVFNPNSARAQQWSKERAEGKKSSRLYEPKGAKVVDTVLETLLSSNDKNAGKRKSLRATFTDPRTLYKDESRSKEKLI